MTATRTRPPRRSNGGVVRSQVEPRLEQRRRRVAEDERQRRRRTGVVLAVVVGFVGAMVAIVFSPLLDIDRIRVVGASQLEVGSVVEASGLSVGDRMIEVDLAEARDALRRTPGVRSAKVVRHWPSTVEIVLTEERAAAELVLGERRLVVATTGRILGGPPAGTDALLPLHLEGFDAGSIAAPAVGAGGTDAPEAPEDVLAAAMALHRMNDHLREQVAAARLSADGLLSFDLTDGATVRLGPIEQLPAKLGAVEAVLAQVHPECRGVIDAREPSRVTVSRTCEGPPVTDGDVASGQPEG